MLLAAPNARELCPPYLAAGSYLTLAMVPLMQAALESSHSLSPDDPVAVGLAKYLERHIPEELHGGAPGRAMLADLEALGVDTVAFREGPLPPKTAEFLGTLFFSIWHRHPVAILGFLALEAFHPDEADVEELIENTDLPRDGFRQLLLHARLDAHHAKELHRTLDSLPLEPRHEQLVGVTALQTIALLTEAWLDVVS